MKFQLIQENFFTSEECKTMIKDTEARGYEEALIRSGQGEVMNKDIRDNDRVIYDSQDLANELWERIRELVPENIDGYEPCGLNERFRFYRYRDGQQFKPHLDGAFVRNENEKSKITMLVYLNEDFVGGATTMVLEYKDIVPKEGMLFLFEHKIMHCGRPVREGTKYVLRTDVMYRKIN